MPAPVSISSNVSRALERIAAAAERAGRRASDVELMAVTKGRPLADLEAAWEAGCRVFGENRVREAEEKLPAFLGSRPGARVEMIGHLQSNKAAKASALFSRVQSVDSLDLALELDKRTAALLAAGRRTAPLEILFELHTGEESKSGFAGIEALLRACEAAASAKALIPRGLMTMAPLTEDPDPQRASFRSLTRAFEAVRSRLALPRFDVLSMGMTNDFEIAIEEGSTQVRLGTALFGARTP